MIEASEVSLKSTIIWVTSDGTMLRERLGQHRRRRMVMVARHARPRVAASTWPRGTDCTPARTISPK